MSDSLWIWTRRFIMIAIPMILVALEWTHPSGFSKNVYARLSHLPKKWEYLHIYQSFLFGGMAVGAYLLTIKINSIWGTLSKIFIWLFAVTYLVFDSTAGISIGWIIENSRQNPEWDAATVNKIVQKLYNDPVIGGSGSFFSLTGSWSWMLGIGAAVIGLLLDSRHLPDWKRLPPLLLLCLSAYALYVGHYSPYGPIAFLSFAAASLWFEFFHFGPAE